ncbi:MAG TPA: hypothetical protein VMJ10_20430 [Kofleriaceae bacterium]|nr:hypothetical protein [Kofleriaceae bacterium]
MHIASRLALIAILTACNTAPPVPAPEPVPAPAPPPPVAEWMKCSADTDCEVIASCCAYCGGGIVISANKAFAESHGAVFWFGAYCPSCLELGCAGTPPVRTAFCKAGACSRRDNGVAIDNHIEASSVPWTVDPAAIQARLQGTWITSTSCPGCKTAWNVEGSKVMVFTEGEQREYDLSIDSPCSLTLRDRDPHYGERDLRFVFDGDTLHVGMGMAAVKLPNGLLACYTRGYYFLDGTGCKLYEPPAVSTGPLGAGVPTFSWLPTFDATCKLDGARLTASSSQTPEIAMTVSGTIAMDDELRANPPAIRTKDWAEAKAAAK